MNLSGNLYYVVALTVMGREIARPYRFLATSIEPMREAVRAALKHPRADGITVGIEDEEGTFQPWAMISRERFTTKAWIIDYPGRKRLGLAQEEIDESPPSVVIFANKGAEDLWEGVAEYEDGITKRLRQLQKTKDRDLDAEAREIARQLLRSAR